MRPRTRTPGATMPSTATSVPTSVNWSRVDWRHWANADSMAPWRASSLSAYHWDS